MGGRSRQAKLPDPFERGPVRPEAETLRACAAHHENAAADLRRRAAQMGTWAAEHEDLAARLRAQADWSPW